MGVDGRSPSEVDGAIATLLPDDEEMAERVISARARAPGSTGSYLSHMMAWDYLSNTRQENEEFALILEDDARFDPYGVQNLERVMQDLEEAEFDILYIGHSPKLSGTRITPLLLRPPSKKEPEVNTNCGFWGYVVRISSLRNMINAVNSFKDPVIDYTIQRNFGELVDALFLVTPLVHQSSMFSVRLAMDNGKL